MFELESATVNKFEADWHPETLFSGYTVKCIIRKDDDFIGQMEKLQNVKRILRRDGAVDLEDFIIFQDYDGNGQLYLKDSTRLVMWKLRDIASFNELFEKIEMHEG